MPRAAISIPSGTIILGPRWGSVTMLASCAETTSMAMSGRNARPVLIGE
jgi:hypothetical protein